MKFSRIVFALGAFLAFHACGSQSDVTSLPAEEASPSPSPSPSPSSSPGPAVTWTACLRADPSGNEYAAVLIDVSARVSGLVRGALFEGAGCKPSNRISQFSGRSSGSYAPGSYESWFTYHPNDSKVSASWTLGRQASGCLDYSSAPPCP